MARGKAPPGRKKVPGDPGKQRRQWLPGKSAEPITITLITRTLAGPTINEEEVARWNAAERERGFSEAMKRLEWLFPAYGIDRTGNDTEDFRLLSLALATVLFRNFEIEDINRSKSYEHKPSNPLALLLLLADVETIKQEQGRLISDPEAIKILRTDKRFSAEWGRITRQDGTLQNWLTAARKPDLNPYWEMWKADEVKRRILTEIVNAVVRKRAVP